MEQSLFGKFYSPYIKNGQGSMDDCYQSYKQDPLRRIELDGRVYSKIISCCRFYGYEDYSYHIVWESAAQIRHNDILSDEYGNEFIVRSFEMIHFFGDIPEWYLNTLPMVITGNTSKIGTYLAPPKESNMNTHADDAPFNCATPQLRQCISNAAINKYSKFTFHKDVTMLCGHPSHLGRMPQVQKMASYSRMKYTKMPVE